MSISIDDSNVLRQSIRKPNMYQDVDVFVGIGASVAHGYLRNFELSGDYYSGSAQQRTTTPIPPEQMTLAQSILQPTISFEGEVNFSDFIICILE